MKGRILILIAIITTLFTAGATFVGTRVAHVRDFKKQCISCRAATLCFELNSHQTDQICKADCQFTEEAFDLNKKLSEERMKLADYLETPDIDDARLMGQVERVIFAHEMLANRVIKHVLAIRPYLAISQQKKLIGLCVDSLNGRWCYKAEMQKTGQVPSVSGLGPTLAQVKKEDAAFAAELQQLQKTLNTERKNLTNILLDVNSTDDQIRRQMHIFTEAHSKMERSVANHVLKIRKTLTVDQQKTLILMLTRGIRGNN